MKTKHFQSILIVLSLIFCFGHKVPLFSPLYYIDVIVLPIFSLSYQKDTEKRGHFVIDLNYLLFEDEGLKDNDINVLNDHSCITVNDQITLLCTYFSRFKWKDY